MGTGNYALGYDISTKIKHFGRTELNSHREILATARTRLKNLFDDGHNVGALVHEHSNFIDQFLIAIAACFGIDQRADLSLVAVGGYGRGELHPYSDVDLLVLKLMEDQCADDNQIAGFVTHLWDVGLQIGHAVRSIDQCINLAVNDVTVATTLMEVRWLCGSRHLFRQLRTAVSSDLIWPGKQFFNAKVLEQRARHARWHDTAHNLEPNIKEGPGGLRDLQVIGWIAKRYFGVKNISELVDTKFLTKTEISALEEGKQYLFKIRFALHLLSGRNEERLLFDHQQALANYFQFDDDDQSLAVEKFMKPYYRTIQDLGRLNELFLELFQESIFFDSKVVHVEPIDSIFQSRNGALEVTGDDEFKKDPRQLLQVFLTLQKHRQLKGVAASTIRLIQDNRSLVDNDVRHDPEARKIFLRIISEPGEGKHELRRMHRYGILSRYLPAFGGVEGQMQYDLFHTYTVDEHSLSIVEHLRAFGLAGSERNFPLCSAIFRRLKKPELLYIAGLFHDIAKGRGGNHSDLGANEAATFCEAHNISPYDTRLVSWLVKNHLVMSVTAQRQDITDPGVINRFAMLVGNQAQLDYLYLLTVADICATNPNLWSSWKDTLLRNLYQASQYALTRGLENPLAKSDLVEDTKEEAFRILLTHGVTDNVILKTWGRLPENYFLRTEPASIAWHTIAISEHSGHGPIILLKPGSGRTMGFVYMQDQEALFAAIVSILDRLGLNILEATIITTDDGLTLDSFVIQEADGTNPQAPARLQQIHDEMLHQLVDPATTVREIRRRPTRQLRHFSIPTQIRFETDRMGERTMMEVITVDRPGLLSRISWALVDCTIQLQNAKVATFGERVEDIFYITTKLGQPLAKTAETRLRDHLMEVLEENHPA